MVEVPSKEEFDDLVGHVGDVILDLSNVEAKAEDAAGMAQVQSDLLNMLSERLDDITIRANRLNKRVTALEGGGTTAPKVETVWGASCGKHTYDYFTQMAGAPLAARRSYENGIPVKAADTSVGQDIGRCASVNSVAFNPADWNTDKATRLEAYLDSYPVDHELFFVVEHEPENPSKKYDPAKYVVVQEDARPIVDRVNVRRVAAGGVPIRFGGNFMSWSARPASGRDMGPWVPRAGTWDFLAWDGYTERFDDLPAEVFGDALAFNKARGLKFAVAETGITTANTPEQRVGWIDLCQQFVADAGGAFWIYWDGSFWTAYLNTVEEFKAVVLGPA